LQNQENLLYDDAVAARKTKGTWGGWRPGAGRKPTLREPVSFTGDIEGTDMDALYAIAEEKGISVASLVREAVAAYVKRQRRK
jgi:hypothetical protein